MTYRTYPPVLDSFVAESIGSVPIVDVRPKAYHEAGHIPTSVNIPFDVVAAQDDDLGRAYAAAFKEAGLSPEDEVIVSCQTGYHAKLVCDALFDEGFERIEYYPGSFEDWVLNPDHPVER